MTSNTQKALKCEAEFLAGAEANFEAAKGKLFRGSSWQRLEEDELDSLKAMMASHRRYDREALKTLPANRRVAIHGYERSWLFWRKKTGVAIASVLTPLEHHASGADGEAPPISLGELISHIRQLTEGKRVSHVIGVCSPSGFTDEARDANISMPNATVVLVEPDEHGGWRTTSGGEGMDPAILQLFDPEDAQEKVDRVRELVKNRSADLLTGSLTASSVAKELGLQEHLVRRGFEQAAGADPELRVSKNNRQCLLYRGAPARRQENQSMNVIDRIKQLFSGEGDEAEKINLLAERRATLSQRRDRMYEDIAKMEEKEAGLLAQGKATTSAVPRRRLAAQLAQMRKDISRQNTTAAMLNKQIDIISTDIHNLTLIQQGEAAQLPATEELTEHAVQAEEMLETLTADSELVGHLETGLEATLASDEELAILKEFEAMDEPAPTETQVADAAPSKTEAHKARSAAKSPESKSRSRGETSPAEDDQQDKSRDADAEAT